MSIETKVEWLKWTMWTGAIVTSIFPLWFGFFNRWWTTKAGASMLFLGIGVALAWDFTLVFNFIWFPSFAVAFWFEMVILCLTIGAGIFVLYALWYNRRHGTMVTVTHEERRDDKRT